jgi:hypothetical protein
MLDDRHLGVLVERDTDPGTLAILLDRFTALTGHSWRGTPATTAHAGIRLAWPNSGQQPRWNEPKKGPGRGVGALSWSRKLTDREREWSFLHTFDASGAYLGAMANADLAWSELQQTGARAFDRRLPGYWLIRFDVDWPDDGRPPLVDDRQLVDGAVWVTTPYAELLGELGSSLDVLDSWTGAARGGHGPARGHRVLRGWAEAVRDARNALGAVSAPLRPAVAVAVKRLYKDAIGGMQRPGMRVSRPDWAHTVIDLWRATLIRRVMKVREVQGVWPVAVLTDSLTYADCVPVPQPRGATAPIPTLNDTLTVAACGVDGCDCAPDILGGLGTFRHEKRWTAAAWERAAAPKVPAPREPLRPAPRDRKPRTLDPRTRPTRTQRRATREVAA